MKNRIHIQEEEFDKYKTNGLGESLEHQRIATPAETKTIDDTLGLDKITIRLQKELVEELKKMAKAEGLGYQPYVRQILTKHVNQLAKQKDLVTT